MKKINLSIFFILLFIYEELIYHLFIFKGLNISNIYIFIFSICYGAIFYLLSNFFKEKLNRIPAYFLTTSTISLFVANFIYYKVYLSIISIYSMMNGNQVFGFMNHIIKIAKENILALFLLILPLFILIILDVLKKISFKRQNKENKLILLLSILIIYVITIITIHIIPSKEIYSNKNLYFNTHSPLLTSEKFGLTTAFRLDVKRALFGFKEKDLVKEENFNNGNILNGINYIIDNYNVKFNKMNIDFDSLISKEEDNTIKDMHTYFKNQKASKQNDYTGMFEGKNLIVFVAEAFSPMAIDKNLTPNLYKLYNEGFQFENFYTPLYPVSTADGEYITDTSLIPKEGVWSIFKIQGNYMPFSYANVFENIGYKSQAYHNNTYTYYTRDGYIETMGYDSYLACKNGLEKRINCKIWPQSDYEMINTTVDDYIDQEHFITYYMTVSGHLEYSRNGNMMVARNWDKVKDLNYSNAAKSYLACNIEFDKAIGELLKKLEEKGKLDDTVIMISGDHYPYGLTLNEVNELSSYEKDENFELHHMAFLLWNSKMEKPIKVTKYSESLDILPTMLNLFNIEYDSRLLMGNDILSDKEGLVIFSNRSFITDNCRYNSLTKTKSNNGNNICTDEEINNYKNIVYNKFKYSRLILEQDYYRKLYKELGLEIK